MASYYVKGGGTVSNVELKQQLDEKQLAIVQSEMEHRKKSTVIAYLLWFFLGSLGAHRFYVRKFGTAVTILIHDFWDRPPSGFSASVLFSSFR